MRQVDRGPSTNEMKHGAKMCRVVRVRIIFIRLLFGNLIHPITHTHAGLDVDGIGRIPLDLLAKRDHEHAKGGNVAFQRNLRNSRKQL